MVAYPYSSVLLQPYAGSLANYLKIIRRPVIEVSRDVRMVREE
jgi:hypothetical protein